MTRNGTDSLSFVSALELGKWILVEFDINAKNNNYTLIVDGKTLKEKFMFSVDGKPERIIFRTGKYRLTDDVQKWVSGDKYIPGWDEPVADEQTQEAIYFIKDFSVRYE
jgi:hypothetical protein